jgi:D-tyrosyl-tRNA(Tyr) deacylase
MKAVIQRVKTARVLVDGTVTGSVESGGLLVLLGVRTTDTEAEAAWMAKKICELRIFADAEGKMNTSVTESGGSVLVVSQFTLYGEMKKGTRPSYISAARPEHAEPLYRSVVSHIARAGVAVSTGVFGASMQVELVNDGPVTIILEREAEAE